MINICCPLQSEDIILIHNFIAGPVALCVLITPAVPLFMALRPKKPSATLLTVLYTYITEISMLLP